MGKGGGFKSKPAVFYNFLKTFPNSLPPWTGFNEGLNAHEWDYNPASSVNITSLFIIFNGRLEAPKKIQNVNFFQIYFWQIGKKSKIDFNKFTF